ncbi:DMT family transporter [Pseudalkalibacillus hwajinpoensis]|uniref:DMT family transporter n=1 Tax=Guptibacillus hwajinpoensis TaxID=208199 RepID=A0A4U1MPA1_9BACL|nr:DMT family transporter [Pseudalkalibacillus hwajinpoensis]TKD72551.1 DMT family transporter [Pseudalkalibacillus hwajinpoensis]
MKKFGLYGGLFLLMVIWGFNVIAIKLLVTEFTPIMIQSIRIFSASLVVFAVLFIAKDLRKLTRKEATYTIFGAVTGVVGHHSFLAVGLTNTSASNAGLILGLVPLMTALFAVLFLKDKMTLLKATGILLALVGVSFVVLSGGGRLGSASSGDIFVFLSVIAQAVSFIFIKKGTETMSSRLMTGWMLLAGSSTLFIIGLLIEPQGPEILREGALGIWTIFAVSAVFATGLGHMFYNKAIYRIGPGEAAVFNNLTPFFALLGAAIFLGEPIGWKQLIGFVLIVAGVMLGTGTVDYLMKRRERRYASLQSYSRMKG